MNIPETFFSVNEQLILFGISCIIGVSMGIVFDVFRALRALLPHNAGLVFAEDLLFLIGWAATLSVFASATARGELRLFCAIGSILGFILYIVTVGSAVIAFFRKLFSVIKGVFSVIMRPLEFVYVFIREKALMKFVGTSKTHVNYIKNIKTLLLKSPHLLYNKRENKKERT